MKEAAGVISSGNPEGMKLAMLQCSKAVNFVRDHCSKSDYAGLMAQWLAAALDTIFQG